MDEIFSNIEDKLKTFAKFNFVCAIILAIICLAWGIMGLVVGCAELLVGLFSSWFIYGFAELLKNVKEINGAPKKSYTSDISQKATQEIYAERRKAKRQVEEMLKAKELTEQINVSAFWHNHPVEMMSLLESQADAKEKLAKATGLTDTEKKELQNLIHTIDEELFTDYEG